MDIKIELIAIVWLFSAASVTQAQGLNKNYDFGTDIGLDITIQPDGYLLCGLSNETNLVYRFVKVDTAGNLIWNKWIGNATGNFSPTYTDPVEVDPFGNVYAAGTFYDTSYNQLLVAKLNSQGDSLWIRQIADSGNGFIYDIFYDSINHKVYSAGAISDLPGDSAVNVLWVLDTAGNTLMLKYFSTSQWEGTNNITLIEDTIFMASFVIDSTKKAEPAIYKLDTLGNILSLNTYGTNQNDGSTLFDYRNNKLVMHAFLDTLGSTYTNSLWLLDVSGQVIWKRVFNDGFQIKKASAMSSGDIIAVGLIRIGNDDVGRLVKLDSIGNIVWGRNHVFSDTIQFTGNDLFNDFNIDNNSGNIVLVGETRQSSSNNLYSQDFWLLRLDSMGCLIPGCDTISPVTSIETLATDNLHAVTVYPNPANGIVTVLVNQTTPNVPLELSFYDLAGKKVFATASETNTYGFAEWQLDLSNLPPSMYLYHVVDPYGKVQTGKLVIE